MNENLVKGISEAHKLGKKFFLANNVLPHNSKIKTFIRVPVAGNTKLSQVKKMPKVFVNPG